MPGTQPAVAARPWARLILLLALLTGCVPGPAVPTVTAFPTAPPPASATPTAALPPALPTARTPAERPVTLDVTVETQYLPGESYERYTLDNDRPRRIGVRLDPLDGGGELRLSARLYSADGSLLPQITAGVGPPLLREEWDLPGAGRYTLELFGDESRPRALALTLVSRPQAVDGGGTIHYGESRSGTIAVQGQRDRWIFEGQAGDRVRGMLVASGDGVLELYRPGGALLARDDDNAALGHHPALEAVLPEDGEYLLLARMYGDAQTGSYQLSLDRSPD